jgi:3-oxoacyl-[acyl-carrier-protein] synthase-1
LIESLESEENRYLKPLAVLATGMVTAVGLDAPSSCAAMRAAIDGFGETRFIDRLGEWIIGAAVPMDPPVRGRDKQARMAASAIAECLPALGGIKPREVPLLLCVAEETRPGRLPGLDRDFLAAISTKLGTQFASSSAVIANGRVGGVEAVLRARQLIDEGSPYCLVAGVDSFLVAGTLAEVERKRRLLTSENSDGFIPGEAAAAVLLGPGKEQSERAMLCLGAGLGMEKATVDSEQPLRADGMAEALRSAVSDSRCGFEKLDYRICDANGEQYRFKEASLALSRTMRVLKCMIELWHPADCIGEIGAAIVPCVLGIARTAAFKGYAPGKGVLCHFGNDEGQRAAMILRYSRHGEGSTNGE